MKPYTVHSKTRGERTKNRTRSYTTAQHAGALPAVPATAPPPPGTSPARPGRARPSPSPWPSPWLSPSPSPWLSPWPWPWPSPLWLTGQWATEGGEHSATVNMKGWEKCASDTRCSEKLSSHPFFEAWGTAALAHSPVSVTFALAFDLALAVAVAFTSQWATRPKSFRDFLMKFHYFSLISNKKLLFVLLF